MSTEEVLIERKARTLYAASMARVTSGKLWEALDEAAKIYWRFRAESTLRNSLLAVE